jgi:hypothetical protein
VSLPTAANVTVDIYRTANPSGPYPSGSPAAAGVPGHLKPASASGRHGTASWLKWTHVLLVGDTADVRDAYNSQLDPARDNSIADTVVLTGTRDPSKKTAFYIVFVELVARGTANAHQRVYLDRFQPSGWPTDAL